MRCFAGMRGGAWLEQRGGFGKGCLERVRRFLCCLIGSGAGVVLVGGWPSGVQAPARPAVVVFRWGEARPIRPP